MPLRKPTGNLPVVFLALKSDRFEVHPARSSSPNIRFIFCTACPEAPFNRLSIVLITNSLSPCFFQGDQAFVGIDHLFEEDRFIAHMGKGRVLIVGLIQGVASSIESGQSR